MGRRRPTAKHWAVRDYVGRWLQRRRGDLRDSSYRRYQAALAHFVEVFGERRMEDIQITDLLDHKAARQLKAAPATVGAELIVLKQVFSDARIEGVIWGDPTGDVKLPRKRTRPREIAVSYAQIRFAILDWTRDNPPFDAIYLLLLNTGMRVGELWALRWEDVDETAIRIRPHDDWQPKTDNRVIPLSRDAGHALKLLAEARRPEQKHVVHLVYTKQARRPGERLNQHEFEKRLLGKFHRLCREEGLPKIRVHDLRGLFTTRALDQGGSLFAVQEIVGHRDPSTTRLYYHGVPSHTAAVMQNFS